MGAGRRWWERWPSRFDSNWDKHCCCCWFGQNDHRITSSMVAESLNIPKILVHWILKEDLGKRTLCARFVPHSLTPEQREDRVTSCQDIIAMADVDKNFFNKIIMGDEIWCFAYDPETKRHCSEWVGETSPRPKKQIPKVPHQDHIDNFFDSQGTVDKEFVTEGKTVNAEFYEGVMDHLLKCIQRVHPAVFCSWDFLLLHDNAPAHKTAKCLPIFVPKKCYNPLSASILSRFISARLFFVPQVENEVKRTPLCRCCWDPRSHNWWIKEGPKRGIFGSFS